MTTPLDPAAADAAVQAQLAEQAAAVQGVTPAAVAGDDPAGAGAPAQPMDLSKATATAANVEELLSQLQDLQERAAAAVAAAEPVPEVPDNTIRADSGAPGWLHEAFSKIEARLGALEGGDGAS